MLVIRTLQTRIGQVLSLGDGTSRFLQTAFPQCEAGTIYEALQRLVLESLGDLYMRFTCEYRDPAFNLLKLNDETEDPPPTISFSSFSTCQNATVSLFSTGSCSRGTPHPSQWHPRVSGASLQGGQARRS